MRPPHESDPYPGLRYLKYVGPPPAKDLQGEGKLMSADCLGGEMPTPPKNLSRTQSFSKLRISISGRYNLIVLPKYLDADANNQGRTVAFATTSPAADKRDASSLTFASSSVISCEDGGRTLQCPVGGS